MTRHQERDLDHEAPFTGFIAYLKAGDASDNTVKTYSYALAGYRDWYRDSYGSPSPAQLLRVNVLDYSSYLRIIRKLNAGSINTKIAALHSYNEYPMESGQQKEFVLTKKNHLKTQVQYASASKANKQQIEALRQSVLLNKGIRDYAMITLMAYGSLRVSEACGVQLAYLNLTAGELRVVGKGDKSRIVYINTKIINAIREYVKVRPQTDSPYLFISRQGGAVSRERINQILKKYTDIITPHDL